MKRIAAFAFLTLIVSAATGCAQSGSPEQDLGTADQASTSSAAFAGTYDGDHFATVKAEGSKLSVTIDRERESYELSPVRPGVYVFTSGDLSGECDNPGCGWVSKFSGVLYMKDFDGVMKPTIKLSVSTTYEHPESEGDFEGVDQTTTYLVKAD